MGLLHEIDLSMIENNEHFLYTVDLLSTHCHAMKDIGISYNVRIYSKEDIQRTYKPMVISLSLV